MIWLAGEDDIEELIDIALCHYPNVQPDLIRQWLEKAVVEPSMVVLRGRQSGGVGFVSSYFWDPAPRGYMVFLAGDVWECAEILRRMAEWAKSVGAIDFRISSETEFDLENLASWVAKKVEATTMRTLPVYELRFKG